MLADNDIVVTTYQILTSDLNRFDAENGVDDDHNDDNDNGNDDLLDDATRFRTKNLKKPKADTKKKEKKRDWKALKAGEHAHPLSKVHWLVKRFLQF